MKVSVIVLSYNHESYITKSLQSIVEQETDFKFEVLVGDDCSQDNSRKIIAQLCDDFPEIIKKVFPKKNIGPNANYLNCFNSAKGQFIAFCEGDDYWIDKNKLQKQVDFLHKNPQYGGVSTNNRWLFHEENNYRDSVLEEGEITFEELCVSNQINSQTTLFQKDLIENIDWMKSLKIGDWALHLLVTNQKPYYRLPEITTVYRVHDKGVHSLLSEEIKLRNRLEVLFKIMEHVDLSSERKEIIKSSIRELLKRIMNYSPKDIRSTRKIYFNYGGSIFNKTLLKSYINELF